MASGSFCGPNQCRIPIVFANGGLKSSFKALGDHKSCHSELRILISLSCDTKILIRIKNWWSNSGVDLVVLLHDSRCLCKWRPQSVVQHPLGGHSLYFGWRVGIVYTHSLGDRPRGSHSDLTYLTYLLVDFPAG